MAPNKGLEIRSEQLINYVALHYCSSSARLRNTLLFFKYALIWDTTQLASVISTRVSFNALHRELDVQRSYEQNSIHKFKSNFAL